MEEPRNWAETLDINDPERVIEFLRFLKGRSHDTNSYGDIQILLPEYYSDALLRHQAGAMGADGFLRFLEMTNEIEAYAIFMERILKKDMRKNVHGNKDLEAYILALNDSVRFIRSLMFKLSSRIIGYNISPLLKTVNYDALDLKKTLITDVLEHDTNQINLLKKYANAVEIMMEKLSKEMDEKNEGLKHHRMHD